MSSSDSLPLRAAAELTAVLQPPVESSFRVVAGVPVIRRAAIAAQRAGFERIIALGGADGARLRRVLDGDRRTARIPVADVPAAVADAGERVVLVPSDCVITPAAFGPVVASNGNGVARFVGAGADEPAIVVGPRQLIGAAPSALADLPRADRAAEPMLRVHDDASARAAEDHLVAGLRSATVETDGPIARLDRAISTRLSRVLVRTPLRPNHITTIGTSIGLLGAWSMSRGGYAGGAVGALLFWVAVILDGCDGEVARLKLQETRFGYLFDVTTDNIVHAAIFLGLGAGVYRAAPDEWHGLLPLLLLGGFALSIAATWFCLIRHPPVHRLAPRTRRGRTRRKLLGGFEALMNRDFAYLLLLLAFINRLYWFLWAAAFGTYLYSAGLVWVYRWRDAE